MNRPNIAHPMRRGRAMKSCTRLSFEGNSFPTYLHEVRNSPKLRISGTAGLK